MERYFVEATKMTPQIELDPDKKVYSLTGNSRPENPMQFYKPMFDWLNSYFESATEKMNLFPMVNIH